MPEIVSYMDMATVNRILSSINWNNIKKYLPLGLVVTTLMCSFIYGWYFDHSKPSSTQPFFSDQKTYQVVTDRISLGYPLTAPDLHFAIGYSLLGVLGKVFISHDPFLLVSLGLLLGSGIFCFLAVYDLYGRFWAVAFCFLLFYWDGVARSLNFSSEIFMMPWNNQVLFFTMSFYFWLLVTRLKQKPSWRLIVSSSLISGICFLVREETILFVVPATTVFLYMTKAEKTKWLVSYSIIALCYMPQIIAKMAVFGSITRSGHDEGYSGTLSQYFRPSNVYNNFKDVVIYTGLSSSKDINRLSLLQASPWLVLSPIGITLILMLKKFKTGLKVFVALSIFLLVFYLSGPNISAEKLKFNCIRYITPSLIALNIATLVVVVETIKNIFSRNRTEDAG